MGGFLIGVIAWIISRIYFQNPLGFWIGLLTMFIVTLISWVGMISWVIAKLDIIPENNVKKSPVKLHWDEDEGRTKKLLDLESVDDDQFLKICLMYRRKESLTIDNLLPLFDGSRPEVSEFRSELVEKRMALWKNANERRGGMVLTNKGEFIFMDFPKRM